MAFVKVLKNKSYFRRFQVKNRRRREGKTDYRARRKMVRQDKNKYNNRKYRLVVRFTNRKVICQILYATIRGDMVVEQATSMELEKFGVPVGLKNYAAAYCTGLLVARRTLKKFGLDDVYKGKEEIDGEDYHVEEEDVDGDKRPLKVILDVGLQTTCVGHRMWGALKGAVDGGLHIPHSNKLFPGFKPGEDKKSAGEYDAEAHKEKIMGVNLKDYMESMQEEDPTKYEAHFSKFIENSIDADSIEDMYSEAHTKIREDPTFTPGDKKGITYTRDGNTVEGSDGTDHVRSRKIGLQARRSKVAKKIAAAQEKMLEDDE
jgi:large subunit ribosomal protein L5e